MNNPSLVVRQCPLIVRKALALLLIGFSLLAGAPPPAAAAGDQPQIWMAATEPFRREAMGWGANDYLELFDSNAPWQQVAQHVRVFQLAQNFIERADPATLSRVIGFLSRHGIAIAMQASPNLAIRGCGRGIESYGAPHDMLRDAERVQKVGGVVSYITMDEPLNFGHIFNGRRGKIPCHSPIETIAGDAARKIAETRNVFPAVQVGETEPYGIPTVSSEAWASMLAEWFSAFRNATGRPLAYEHADIVWNRPGALPQFEAALPVIRQAGIPLGVIYNGTALDRTSATWVADARSHIALIEGRLRIRPQHVIFQSWMALPRMMLPESSSDTLTGLVEAYIATH